MAEMPGDSWSGRLAWFIGSGFGCGLSPLAPGSVGSLAAVIILYLLSFAMPGPPGGWERMAILAAMSVAGLAMGVWATGRMSTLENPDPGSATWDEFVGMWLTCLLIPFHSPVWLAIAFLVFRALDVLKPWPCRRLERLPAGWGIMLDDVGAGLWGMLIMLLLLGFYAIGLPLLAGLITG